MAKKKAKRSTKGNSKGNRSVEVAYLDPDKLALLKQLADKTRIARAVLMREAVDDLLIKHKMMTEDKKPTQK